MISSGGDDFVSDEKVTDFGLGVKGEDIGPNPLVGEVLARRNVDDEFVRNHDGDP